MFKYFLLSLCIILAESTALRGDESQQNVLYSGPIAPDLGAIAVPVGFRFGSTMCLIDTGASITVLDQSFLPYIDDSKGDAVGGQAKIVDARLSVAIGRFQTEINRVALYDFQPAWESQDVKFMGVLGMDVLSQLCLTLDHDNRMITLSRKSPLLANFKEASITFAEGGRPFIIGGIGDQSVAFLIDSGAIGGVYAPQAAFDSFEEPVIRMPESVLKVGGIVQGRAFIQSPNLRFREWSWKNLMLERSNNNQSFGKVGRMFLARLNISFDFPARRAIMCPSKAFEGRDCSDRSGLVLQQTESVVDGANVYCVMFVRSGSDADLAGILPDDRIVRVDSPHLGSLKGASAYRAFTIPRATDVEVHVLRNGSAKVVRIPAPGEKRGQEIRDKSN